ncbi:glutamyl-tRNA reductase [uncultured Thiothrix sp.]|uniref:glutamyl-tRNA reductase n=1 Tax=uncultured Thiothrix sp. TaxID=223185 RepID=UPI0026068DCB|nr:glutamyl-tRNA reductase [uncultured Thiothrix sp.]HMT93385.1 glutamyl-tRNA reductase [Thiolinea sp.]
MSIFVVGVNHRTAPVAIREQVAFSPERLLEALHAAKPLAQEHLILSTCNRTELYATCHEPEQLEQLISWLARFHNLPQHKLQPYLFVYQEEQAIQHAMRVACGLDSLVLGEPQILGQLKTALQTATEAQTTGHQLTHLMQHAFNTAKKVRTQTSIGANPVSVAFAAVSLSKQIFSQLEKQTALLVGAGETIELVGRHLNANKIGHIIVANRNVERARKVAEPYHGLAIGLPDIADYLPKADIVISSTAAPLPIIGKGMVERALKVRKHRPMFMVDIAVPRDIEPEVGQLDDVYLYTVDDLQSVIEENLQSRRAAAEQAESMVLDEVESFMGWLRAQEHRDTIRQFRQQNEAIRDEVLARAQKMLQHKEAAEVLEFLANTLTNKLTHAPIQSMNQAAQSGNDVLLANAKTLFNLIDEA